MGKRSDGKGGKNPGADCERGEIEYVDGEVAKAMAHPLRIQIVAMLNQRVMSATMIAKETGEPLQNVAYHFRVLREKGLIEEVDSRQVRGSTEHFYLATKRVLFDGKAWDDLPQSMKAKVSSRMFSDFLEVVSAAMLGETFDSSDERVNVWRQGRLDERGWEEAVAAHWTLIHAMEDIFKGARVRLLAAGEPDGGTFSAYGQHFFEATPPATPKADDEEQP
jgi:DNA-binding transcriptional ArsR family regulator